jgi:hypothetical protein
MAVQVVAVRSASGRGRDVLGLPWPLTDLNLCPGLPNAASEMVTTILEDAVRFSFSVSIKISYPEPRR